MLERCSRGAADVLSQGCDPAPQAMERRGPGGPRAAPAAGLRRAAAPGPPVSRRRAAGPHAAADRAGPRGVRPTHRSAERAVAEPRAVLRRRGAADAAHPRRSCPRPLRREARWRGERTGLAGTRGRLAAGRRGDRARRGPHRAVGAGPGAGPGGVAALLLRPDRRGDRGGPAPLSGHHQAGVEHGQSLAPPGPARGGAALMTPERWQTVKRLFHEALDQAPEGRTAYLERACAGDTTLRKEVETLLSSERESAGFMEEPAAASMPPAADPAAVLGRRIGSYRVLREIGHGGMGAVFLAVRDDDAYRKQVAIKLVRAFSASDLLVDRFRQERHILAALDHPNIARLLDGGATDDGLPYLVMEYVEGVPIDEYCEAHALSLRDRLALFRTVCSAVQFAHQNLVVHRDIKPANILIAADGTPKLLDFGIAKLLSPELAARGQAATAFPMMTPDYASPEQVRNEPITTASDVYSLGVLLYRVLTGRGPYRVPTGAVLEVIEAVRDQEPQRPSAIVPKLAGDLDNIVLRALRKEPRERYASVDELSADIRRHLEGQPVSARKATVPYRAGKFVRRHKVGVAAAALLFLSLVGGILTTLREARIARAERARAERRFNDVRKLANSFLFEVHDAIERLPGSTAARELVIKRALEYLDKLAQEA